MARDPRTPDCLVRGCKKAARQLGLCREHRAYVPFPRATEIMLGAVSASVKYAKKEHLKLARAIERGELKARS